MPLRAPRLPSRVAPSTLEAIDRVMPDPRRRRALGPRLEALIETIGCGVRMTPVDLAIVGGDPLTLGLRLARLVRARQAEGRVIGVAPITVAVFFTGRFSGAPLAALGDPEFLWWARQHLGQEGLFDHLLRVVDPASRHADDAVALLPEAGPGVGLPVALGDPQDSAERAWRALDAFFLRTAAELDHAGIRLLCGVDILCGDFDPLRQEIVVCLGAEAPPEDSPDTPNPIPNGALEGHRLAPAPSGAGRTLFERSAGIARSAALAARSRLFVDARPIVIGKWFARGVLARRVEVLSGAITGLEPHAPAARRLSGSEQWPASGCAPSFWPAEKRGAPALAFAHLALSLPATVATALDLWQGDLLLAARGRIAATPAAIGGSGAGGPGAGIATVPG